MSDSRAKSVFRDAFLQRVKQARSARYTQVEIAALLGIEQDTYKQYETRSLLPHHLIPKFCIACGIDSAWLFADIPNAQSQAERPKKPRRRGQTRDVKVA